MQIVGITLFFKNSNSDSTADQKIQKINFPGVLSNCIASLQLKREFAGQIEISQITKEMSNINFELVGCLSFNIFLYDGKEGLFN